MNSGFGDGQGGLVCCDSWGGKESDMTERLNRTEEEGMGSISGPGTKIPNVANTAKYINKCSHIQEALH